MPTHHAIDYVELSVGDLSASTRFYADAFGWRTTDYGPTYTGFRDDPASEEEGGGLAATDERPGRPLVLLYSDDLDATVAAVEAAGGTVTQAPYAFPGGRRFHFTDPTGNELGAWSER
ncbi:MAG TPA: VOC family protein [Nocardioides sp.]